MHQSSSYTKEFTGIPFKWGGTHPDDGLDCFTLASYISDRTQQRPFKQCPEVLNAYKKYPNPEDAPPYLLYELAQALGLEPARQMEPGTLLLIDGTHGMCLGTCLGDDAIAYMGHDHSRVTKVHYLPDGSLFGMWKPDRLQEPVSPVTDEGQFLSAIAAIHDIQLCHQDYDDLLWRNEQARQHGQKLFYMARNDSANSRVLELQIESGKVLKIAANVAVGFFSGGGWLGAGLALAGGLFGGSKKKERVEEQKKEEERFNQTYGIDSGGQLAVVGSPVPVIGGSRSQSVDLDGHECGGVRVGGLLISSEIETLNGTNYLTQLWALSAGASPYTGLGQIRSIDTESLLFDGQPRKNFIGNEIETIVRPGSQSQSPIQGLEEYSENISPTVYQNFGCDRRTQVQSFNALPSPTQNSVNNAAFTVGGDGSSFSLIRKTITTNQWDSYAWSALPIQGFLGSTAWIQFEAGNTGEQKVAGLASFPQAINVGDLAHAFYFQLDGRYAIYESGAQVFGGGIGQTYSASDVFRIQLEVDRLFYQVNGVTVFTSSVALTGSQYGNVLFWSENSSFANVQASSALLRSGVNIEQERAEVTVSVEGAEVMDAGDNYAIAPVQSTRTQFRIVSKVDETLTIDNNQTLPNNEWIWAYWVAKFETTKRVTAVEFNLSFNLSSRTPDNSDYKSFGVAFQVVVYRYDNPPGTGTTQLDTAKSLGNFFVRSLSPATQYRSIRFYDLPLGRYVFEFQPLEEYTSSADIWELTSNNSFRDVETSADLWNGSDGYSTVRFRIEGQRILNSVLQPRMDYDTRTQISSASGPTGRIVSVNQKVDAAAIGLPQEKIPQPYSGIAVMKTRYRAGGQVSSNLSASTPVDEGRSIPNYMAAGRASGLSVSFTLSDPSKDFVALGIKSGWIIENLDKGIQGRLIDGDVTELTADTDMQWSFRDRYVVWYEGSTPFFSDNLADALRNQWVGAGSHIDGLEDIDYPSFVAARDFCRRRRLYWNGLIHNPPQPIKQWAEQEARGSLLIPGTKNGRWALFIEERGGEAPQVFNESNIEGMPKLEWDEWINSSLNRVSIRYRDGRDLFTEDGARFRTKLVTVSTVEAYEGTEPALESIIDMASVNSPLQAAEVAIASLNSARTQDRTITFPTGMQAAYLEGGEFISVQHSSLNLPATHSGFVAEAEALAGNVQRIRLNQPACLYEGLTSAIATDGAQLENAFLGNTSIAPGDLLINVVTGVYGIITSTTGNKILAPVACDRGDLIRVIDLTAPNGSASVTYRTDGTHQDGLNFYYEQRGVDAWAVISGLRRSLELLDPVNLNADGSLFRVDKVTPSGKAKFNVSARSHPGEPMYSRAGLVVEFDDYVIRETDALTSGSTAVVPPPPTSVGSSRVEAEAMTLTGYEVQNQGFASDGALISLTVGDGAMGSAEFVFAGDTGDYDLTIAFHDVEGGSSLMQLFVDGALGHTWQAPNLSGGSVLASNRTLELASNINIPNGATVRVEGTRSGPDRAYLDYIDFSLRSGVIIVGDRVKIEAESMNLIGFSVIQSNSAGISGFAYISGNINDPANNYASTTFPGTSGQYNITVAYFDVLARRGLPGATMNLSIAGNTIDAWTLDEDLDFVPSEQSKRTRVLNNVTVNNGDFVQLRGIPVGEFGNWDRAAIDSIEFDPVA